MLTVADLGAGGVHRCSLKTFENGVNLLYNDKIFQDWCNKWNSTLIQKDFVNIQTQSTIMKQLIKAHNFPSRYSTQLMDKVSKGTVTKEYKSG